METTQDQATPVAAPPKPRPTTVDRTKQDVGNIIALEHANFCIPDQRIATTFYVVGLGLTRDPYMRVGPDNMGINIGRGQLHLGTSGTKVRGVPRPTQRLRGTIGLVVPDLGDLAKRLEKVKGALADTQFAFQVHTDRVEVTCPWGNRFCCHAPNVAEFGDTELAIGYIEFDVPRGTAPGIARFYKEVMLAPTSVETRRGNPSARIEIGPAQKLWFRGTDDPIPPYDGHHIQIYLTNYSRPFNFFKERGLIIEGSITPYQFNFNDIVDVETKKVLFTVEHEVRSMKHPSFNRPLVNRNPAQTNDNRERGHDAFRGSLGNI